MLDKKELNDEELKKVSGGDYGEGVANTHQQLRDAGFRSTL